MTIDTFIQRFNDGLAVLLQLDKQILTDQGHRASGKLIDTLSYEIVLSGNTLTGTFLAQDYGLDLDRGISASEIGGLDQYTKDQAFRRWVKTVLGKSEKEVSSTIYFIWRKWKKEGMPTKNSSAFSKTGERTNWIKKGTEAFEKDEMKFFNIELSLDDLFEQAFDLVFEAA